MVWIGVSFVDRLADVLMLGPAHRRGERQGNVDGRGMTVTMMMLRTLGDKQRPPRPPRSPLPSPLLAVCSMTGKAQGGVGVIGACMAWVRLAVMSEIE